MLIRCIRYGTSKIRDNCVENVTEMRWAADPAMVNHRWDFVFDVNEKPVSMTLMGFGSFKRPFQNQGTLS